MEIDTGYTDFITCPYCGYEDESPTPELIKEACDHESICKKNPYTAQIRNLKHERDEAREDAEHWKTEYEIVADRLPAVELRKKLASALVERDEDQKELSSIYRWIERNHADGFIDSLTYLKNLERVMDCWYDRLDKIERERNELLKAMREILKVSEPTPVLTYQKMEDIASKALKEQNDTQTKNYL